MAEPRPKKAKRAEPRYGTRLAALGGLAFFVILSLNASTSITYASLIALAATTWSLVLCYYASPAKQWSPAFLFLSVLAAFHVGALAFSALGSRPWLPNSRDAEWFYSSANSRAAALVAIGLASYAVGVAWFSRGGEERAVDDVGYEDRYARFGRSGFWILAISIFAWYAFVLQAGGPSLMFASYSTFLSATAGSGLSLVYALLSLGAAMSAFCQGRQLKAAVVLFLVFALVAFPLGLRGEVLIPATAAIMVRAKMGHRLPSLPVLLLVVVLCLTAVSGVKQLRQTGLGSGVGSIALAPAQGMAELGYSIRVVETSVVWHEQDAEPHVSGATYLAPLDRAIQKYIFGAPRVDAEMDERLMNVLISKREGNIGGSMVGEAHHNFGTWGVVFVLLLVGAVFGALSRASMSPTVILSIVAVGLPLLNHVRNSFVQVPSQIVAYALVLAIAWSMTMKRERHRSWR